MCSSDKSPSSHDDSTQFRRSRFGSSTGRLSWWFPLAGFVSLLWFLARVIPRPSRAAYPCQQVAAPLAGGFVVWIAGLISSVFAYRKGIFMLSRSRIALAGACLVGASILGFVTLMAAPDPMVMASPATTNDPIGEAKGVNPGRVVWVHDADATDWDGPGDGHWWEPEHTRQVAVDLMMSRAIRYLAGEGDEQGAWDALIRLFNVTHGNGDVGYIVGEKIAIKVNFVGFLDTGDSGNVDPITYDLVDRLDYMNTSPQMMLALLRQLVNVVGVSQADITIGDPVALFPNQYYDPLFAEFPNICYLDSRGWFNRTGMSPSSVDFYWSNRPSNVTQDKVLTSFAEATYFINLANLKSHSGGGVTLCGKNYYGWLRRPPIAGYYNMHDSLPSQDPTSGSYRCMVDLMGHAHSGGKALLYLVDGLYAGVHPDEDAPIPWDFAPFNGDWTSSLFASQDPVAIDSVGFDFLQEEGDPRLYPQMAAADDYLIEAAQANAPPSGTFYDPDHGSSVSRLTSLGVHEHWNNSVDMQYSRNLDPVGGQGIELVIVRNGLLFEDGFESGDPSFWSGVVGG
ncbi:MAG: hypothetical protein DRJ61_10315 [Acidobacteria bacterium]|nr:MAG: hypothetical protein DRJ61_10315 [Acidobacteriota bacterium]